MTAAEAVPFMSAYLDRQLEAVQAAGVQTQGSDRRLCACAPLTTGKGRMTPNY
jgi:hypothetical protein